MSAAVLEPLRDIIGNAIFTQPPTSASEWYEKSSERREGWRKDADRVIDALWIDAVASALPGPEYGPYLVTNNKHHRDARGCMAHVFVVGMLQVDDNGEVCGFDSHMAKIWGIVAYMPIRPAPRWGETPDGL